MIRIAIIGEFDEAFRPHVATNEALLHAMKQYGLNIEYGWISTETVLEKFSEIKKIYNGFLIAPGSPYKSMQGALQVIQFAQHAEYDPYASDWVITPLSCSLKGQTLEIDPIKYWRNTIAISD